MGRHLNSTSQKVVVVTGAASGIGFAALRLMRQDGVIIVGVDLSETPAELQSAADVKWIRGDVAAQETWNRVKETSLRFDPRGACSLIACAAGVVVAPLVETPIEEWRRLFEVNVLGVVRAMQILLPGMIERGQGAIAVVCSVNSLYVEDQLSAYSTSKAALLHLVRAAALEYARYGVRINAVCPGAVDTPLLQAHLASLKDPAAARRAVRKRTPTGTIIKPEEVAAVLRFAVSDEASGLSGAALVVDGGLTTTYDFDSEASV